MSPDADDADASPSPQPSGDHTFGDMSEMKSEREGSDDKSPSGSKDGNESNSKRNAKDPSRPRRKKARRACFACQRAHLTCGDERPCLRCIKRGLQDHCHDGVRKKAKYLHDAPNEALVPGMGGSYQGTSGAQATTSMPAAAPATGGPTMVPSGAFFNAPLSSTEYNGFDQTQTQSPTIQDNSMLESFVSQAGTMNQSDFESNGQQVQPGSTSMDPTSVQLPSQNGQYNAPFIDPTDPSFFNFDISGLNFGNHYGALEFGMLGHMSSGAGDQADDSGLMSSMNSGSVPFDTSGSGPNAYSTAGPGYTFPSNNGNYQDWQSNTPSSRHGSASQMYGATVTGGDGSNSYEVQPSFPNAFAIGEGNGSISSASPGASMDFIGGYTGSPASAAKLFGNNRNSQQHDFSRQQSHQQSQHQPQQQQQQQRAQNKGSFPPLSDLQEQSRKRKRDSANIYSSVQAPYSYTTGFHSLTAFLQRRFSPQKTLRIAKALASIRPSFISSTKELNRDDLIFMEKCFQRTLLQYDDFINAYGTPTIICRRTGEVAAVSKEFSLLTGWRRDLLLGKEPNLNVNTGGTSGVHTGASSRGNATPRVTNGGVEITAGRPQPVFLAELLDDDSVIHFYEDFAKLAFGDSRGYVIKPCKLLKYKTKDDPGWSPEDEFGKAGRSDAGVESRTDGKLYTGPAGMHQLGDKDGKVNCMYCWSVKRDVFDIPMMVVMNFLPCI